MAKLRPWQQGQSAVVPGSEPRFANRNVDMSRLVARRGPDMSAVD
jgi:hypothetical protein